MKRKKVYVLSGPPACGKSTWTRANMTVGSEWISRDNVRFSILKDGEDYFSHEDEVFDTFIAYINQTLENPNIDTIFIDATHLNKRSRHKTLSRVRRANIEELNCVCFSTPLAVCQARNHLREGRAKVPASAIDNMYNVYFYPGKNEGFDHVYEVDQNGITKEVSM